MARYAAFLRGINVGGHSAKKEQLVSALDWLGFEDVTTFRASGNLLFDAGGRRPKAADLEVALEGALGYAVPVFLRSASQVAGVAALEPFSARQLAASTGKLQVAFLPGKPSAKACESALELATEDEPLAIEGTELLWLPKAGMMDSDLDLKALERLLGPWTMRTMGTVEQMAERLAD